MRSIARRGALVLVGGHSRGVGKTTAVEHILRARRGERWVAIKISAHRHGDWGHGPSCHEDFTPDADTQTGRYLRAGAARALLLRAPDAHLGAAVEIVNRLRASGLNLIVESNRLVDGVTPDRVLFAVAPDTSDWKASSARAVSRADAFVVLAEAGPGAADVVRAADPRARDVFRLGEPGDDLRLADWLDSRLAALPLSCGVADFGSVADVALV